MATSIELEDYDLKKNKVYLAISQSIDTVNFEQKKVCLVGDDNRCLYQEERKFCSQTFFLLYDLSSDSVESKTRQFEGSCHGDTNKLVFLVVDSTHIIATESTHLYNYDMSTHLINMENRWNSIWEWKLESVQYLSGNKNVSNLYTLSTKRLVNKKIDSIRSEIKVYVPKSNIWGFGLIRGYKDSTLQNKRICVLILDSLNTSNKYGDNHSLYYLPEKCQLNPNLFKYVNLFATQTDVGMQIDSITSPMDQILTRKKVIDISFGINAHNEVEKNVPQNFTLDELYYASIFELFSTHNFTPKGQTFIPKAHLDSLYFIHQCYNKKIENLKKVQKKRERNND